jgi:hypothetical protein
MKFIYNKIKPLALAALMALGACDRGFEEMNISPNEPTEVLPAHLLASAQKQVADLLWDSFHSGRFGMLYAQYWAQNEYTDESRYQFRVGSNNAFWRDMYTGPLTDLQDIIRINEANMLAQSPNQIAVARIMKAYIFQVLTDVYGDIPYASALQGRENTSPAYTPQSEIYADLLKELTEASSQINPAVPGFASGDLMYGGNMTRWKKFANSLKMRVAIRMADINASAARTAINEALTAGVFTSNDDNALFRYMAAQPNNNPLHQDRLTRADFAASNTLVDALNQRNDPRVRFFAAPNAAGQFEGLTYGLTQDAAGAIPNSAVSQPSPVVLQPTSAGIFMLYDEVQFIQAEAAQRGFITGNAAQFFQEAISASMRFWSNEAATVGVTTAAPITDAQIAAYLTANPYNAANWRQSIGVQKWIALYMQGHQGWIEWRRLDFGVLQPPAAGPLLGTGIPTRHMYPEEEQNLNRENYQTAVNAQGGQDIMGGRVWWDVN